MKLTSKFNITYFEGSAEELKAILEMSNMTFNEFVASHSNDGIGSAKPSAVETGKGTATKTTLTKDEREAQRAKEKEDFKANHNLVRSAKENKKLVYAEMEKQGIKEFNRKDYERIAKGLGVLGKSGKVVSTWEEK